MELIDYKCLESLRIEDIATEGIFSSLKKVAMGEQLPKGMSALDALSIYIDGKNLYNKTQAEYEDNSAGTYVTAQAFMNSGYENDRGRILAGIDYKIYTHESDKSNFDTIVLIQYHKNRKGESEPEKYEIVYLHKPSKKFSYKMVLHYINTVYKKGNEGFLDIFRRNKPDKIRAKLSNE